MNLFFIVLILSLCPVVYGNTCEPGYYHPVTEAGENCYPCNPGRYASTRGMPVCIDCPPGRFSIGYARTVCETCAPGSYQPSDDSISCRACPAGTTQPHRGATECATCDRGYAAVNSTSPCLLCPMGTKWEPGNNGLGICTPCPAGTFSDRLGSYECTPCPHNTYNGAIQQTVCKSCEPGFFTYDANSTHVDQCLWCEDAIGGSWPRATWPYTERYSVVNLFSCIPYLCDSQNAVGRVMCRNFFAKDVTHLSQLCTMRPDNSTSLYSLVTDDHVTQLYLAVSMVVFSFLLVGLASCAFVHAIRRR